MTGFSQHWFRLARRDRNMARRAQMVRIANLSTKSEIRASARLSSFSDEANDSLTQRLSPKASPGTTATLAAIHDNKLYLANVGDSRAYLVRDGELLQLTSDHTWAREMIRRRQLSAEEAAKQAEERRQAVSPGSVHLRDF